MNEKIYYCLLKINQLTYTDMLLDVFTNFTQTNVNCCWQNLYGSSQTLAILRLAEKTSNLILVLTPTTKKARQILAELKFFRGDKKEIEIFRFPDWETLPYDRFSPHQDIVSNRLETLSQLTTAKRGIVVLSVNTAMHRLVPRDYIAKYTLIFKKGQEIDLLHLRDMLISSGYRLVTQVMEHGEFAVRGSIIDIFPMGSRIPYRIDFFGNEIDTIRQFDPDNQRSGQEFDKINFLPAHEFILDEEAISHFTTNWQKAFGDGYDDSLIYQNVSKGIYFAGIEYYLPLFFAKTGHIFRFLNPKAIIINIGDTKRAAENFWHEIDDRYEQLRHDREYPLLPPKVPFLAADDLFNEIKKFSLIFIESPICHSRESSSCHSRESDSCHSRESDSCHSRESDSCHSRESGNLDLHFRGDDTLKFRNDDTQKLREGNTIKAFDFVTKEIPDLTLNYQTQDPLTNLKKFLTFSPPKILFCTESQGRAEALTTLLKPLFAELKVFNFWQEFYQDQASTGVVIGQLERALYLDDIVIIPEYLLYGQQVLQRQSRLAPSVSTGEAFRDLTELKIGDPIVHVDYGIGKYLGLQNLTAGGMASEYLVVEYANEAKLYIPITSLHLISRYVGAEPENITFNELGTKQWERAKHKAIEKIRDVAAELLEIYAKRAVTKGHAFSKPNEQYQAFSSNFPFELTIDQEKAVNDVINDMTAARPMDRLICGDVGFGKTEVAMRAAFIAVHDNKQIAILAPTTILAQQHFNTFKDRFAGWPVNIMLFSRFTSAADSKAVVENLKEGKIDIVIGTHKLLQENIKFKDLGLLIIDEEHRFGVKQKEKIKALRANIDILTLTATPIPRTLNMAFSNIRDLSIIATPPAKRLAIKTFVREYDKNLIREAILREIMRGGQVYFLHNNVANIERVTAQLQILIPEGNFVIAHGQMRKRQLEFIMRDFYRNRFNILVCTTIIESGIDIPTANTIIINNADRFGLAQLHQLRGRVGRSHHQAYAYLLVNSLQAIARDAKKRLDAIASMEELGAGFMLAVHDLEIRGAGEILGEEQSGQIQDIGFNLYIEFLEKTVKALQAGKVPDFSEAKEVCDVELAIPALIPENYMADAHIRLMFYKKIASASTNTMLRDLQVEMIDRFGLLPKPLKNLFVVSELRLVAQTLGITQIKVGKNDGILTFSAEPKVQPERVITLVKSYPHQYKLLPENRLKFTLAKITNDEEYLEQIEKTLELITND
jgi:transcription-repair coupling factor (superfamily II helicase)